MNDEQDRDPERPETLRIALERPIELNKGRYDALDLREPTVGEMLRAEGHLRKGVTVEAMRLRDIHLVAAVSGWPVAAVERLPVSKMEQATEFLLAFAERTPTAETAAD